MKNIFLLVLTIVIHFPQHQLNAQIVQNHNIIQGTIIDEKGDGIVSAQFT